jgi:hypothetical protein
LICHGGVQKWSKSIKIDRGVPWGSFYKFFENSSHFAKAPPFSTPNIDPHKWPYWTTHSPQIGCALAPMGGTKLPLFGGSGGGPLGPKIVDTTIYQKSRFGSFSDPQISINFTPSTPPAKNLIKWVSKWWTKIESKIDEKLTKNDAKFKCQNWV